MHREKVEAARPHGRCPQEAPLIAAAAYRVNHLFVLPIDRELDSHTAQRRRRRRRPRKSALVVELFTRGLVASSSPLVALSFAATPSSEDRAGFVHSLGS